MKSKLNLLIIAVLISASAQGQSGYLGSLDAIGVNVNLIPSRIRTTKVEIDSKGDSIAIAPLRYLDASFSLSYSRVVARKIELGVGYTFTSMRTASHKAEYIYESSWYTYEFNVLQDLKAQQHAFNFSFRYYRKGSLAPTGKYLGFSFNKGFMNTKEDELIPVSLGGRANGDSRWVKKREIESILPGQTITNTSGNYFSLRGFFGRNFPIGNKLMFNFNASFPILSVYKNDRFSRRGLQYYFDNDYAPKVKDNDFGQVVNYTMHVYNRAFLSMGLRFQL